MFEHMKVRFNVSRSLSSLSTLALELTSVSSQNYEFLLRKISTWLKPNKEAKSGEALLFVHIFCHRDTPYVPLACRSPSRS